MSRPDPVLRLLPRLTTRDLQLLDWLADHQVLTTPQINHALFGHLRLAQRRLLALHQLGLIERFRALRPGGGSYPWHHVLGHTGAELIAATRDQPPPRPNETARRLRRIATSRTLGHRLGVNQFFTDLAGHARTHPGCRLDRWWSEEHCAIPGAFAPGLVSPIRPDGHGIWAEGDRQVAFYLEYDTGSEVLDILTGKISRYTVHASRGGPAWPVLFVLHSPTREAGLHQRLAQLRPTGCVVATTSRPHSGELDPATSVWHVAGRPRQSRLADLR